MSVSRVLDQVRTGAMTLARERIARIEGDGRMFLHAAGAAGPEIACDVLAGAGGSAGTLAAGQEVLVAWPAGPSARPVLLGPITGQLTPSSAAGPARTAAPDAKDDPAVERIEGRKIHVSASEELVLECGPAEIRITADGKIIIRGEHVLSRARGTQRIKGGSVAIN